MRAHNELATAHHVQQDEPDGRRLAAAVEVLGHLADATRLHLLQLLAVEQDVSTLAAQVKASRSSVSQHLSRLRLAGLVQARREGRRMIYRITSDHLTALVADVLDYADHTVRDIPHHQATP
ncbi:metalloregulator ArsR/SmtB family transcription factor [Lentzea sp. BCCO 10_0798]|uniref:Metalloregulator ArsR/SmtB family transcription factor n=1 Tax=Lentzea kristufekii TaxID=3095430 RepID=A0ABU4TKS2_9PSEU|nr:metalloregulator ArsR/SmtB family transcription factor [Lentzea sp. BCCO 10_0798]MDX8048481.1 metalloregulator ArsR/SmtB family transcription factor [Lentzea sp. BCCO 10_0798]